MSQTKAQLLDGKSATIQFTGGSASAPSVSFTGDTNTGIYSPGADQVAISTNSTQRLLIDASGNVNIDSNTLYVDATNNRVGIGTTDPQTALDVRGEASIAYNATYGLRFYNQDRNNWSSIGNNIATGGTSANLVFKDSTGEVARMTGGRLLVGTSSSPSAGAGQYALSVVQGYAGGATGEGIVSIARGKVATAMANTDTIGQILFTDNAGNTFSKIISFVDGTVSSTSDLPGALSFSTTADGASSPTERARLNNLGYLTGTVNGLGNGLYLANQFYRLNSGNVGSNATGAQSVFGVGVSLIADTVYAFESFYVLQKSAGTTSHTVAVSFGGTAGLNNINYGIIWNRDNTAAASSNMTGIAGAYQSFATAASSLVLTSAIASANQTITLKLSGTVSISTAGTFVPQYTLSAAPGGAYTTLAGSYFKIAALGAAGSNISIGSWA